MPEGSENIWVVIPAYNEAASIAEVIRSLKTHGYERILVVDDGSQDATGEIALQAGARIVRHILNRGQGAALATGFAFLEKFKIKYVITFDADGQHHAEDIDKLLLPLRSGEADIVLGSRFLNPENTIPFFRKLVLKAGILFTNITSQIKLTDTHNGLRALNRKAHAEIKITQRGMEHASEIIEEIPKKRLRYKEVPVTITYSLDSLQKGQKTSNFIKIGLKVLLRKLSN